MFSKLLSSVTTLLSGAKAASTLDVLSTVISGTGAVRLSIKGVRKIVIVIDDVSSRPEMDSGVKAVLDRGVLDRI